jgi:hypothetical protein
MCICDDCYTTTTNAENVNTGGATYYREYCNLNRCDSSGEVWSISGGQIQAPTPPPPPPDHFVPLKTLAAKVGVSPNVAAGVLLMSALLILYVCYSQFCGSRHHGHHSDGRGRDLDSSDDDDDSYDGKYHRYTKKKKHKKHKKHSDSDSGSNSGSDHDDGDASDQSEDQESHHHHTHKHKHEHKHKHKHRHDERP